VEYTKRVSGGGRFHDNGGLIGVLGEYRRIKVFLPEWANVVSDLTILHHKVGGPLAHTEMTRWPLNSTCHGISITDAIRRHVFDGHIGDVRLGVSNSRTATRFSGYWHVDLLT